MAFAMIAYLQLESSDKFLVPLSILIVFIVGALVLASASVLNKLLGKEFVRGLEKVTAVLLAIIASEMIMNGVRLYFAG
jgi:small neutral amino acid transporter SnatA (MarC family)